MKNPHRQKKPSEPAVIADKERADGERAEPNATNLEETRCKVEAKNLALYPKHEPRLVAEIASRLLGIGNDFNLAAKRALDLLDACDSATERRRKLREANNIGQMRHRDVPAHLPYRDGIKHITGQSRTDRAEKAFVKFLPYFHGDRGIPEKTELRKSMARELAEAIARYKQEGFEQGSLAAGKRLFLIWSGLPKNSR